MKTRVLSGIRATGLLHLGNYLGAVKGMLELQSDPQYETFYMVADAHTLTTPYDSEELRSHRVEVVLDYLSCGLDPEKSTIFIQSEVPAHFECAFYLSTVETIARIQHLPTFKDKVKQHPEAATMALLNYPLLMAADILLYQAALVPVGIDQEPHLEVTRQVARQINALAGTTLPEPQRFATRGEYVPALSGQGKMSKSVRNSFISLRDTKEEIAKKISAIPTDSGTGTIEKKDNRGRTIATYTDRGGSLSAGVASLFEFVELFQGEAARGQLEAEYQSTGVRYGQVKQQLADAIFISLQPIQEQRAALQSNPSLIDEVIAAGVQRARQVSQETLSAIKAGLGLPSIVKPFSPS